MTFKLEGETFGVDIDEVQEVLEFIPLTAVPRTDMHVKGIIRLRGVVVPVVDLRQRLGHQSIEPTRDSAIIILDLPWRRGSRYFGAVVDGVDEVVDMSPQSLLPPPRTSQQPGAGFIRSMGRHGEKFVMILDTRALFTFGPEEASQEQEGLPPKLPKTPPPEEDHLLVLPEEDPTPYPPPPAALAKKIPAAATKETPPPVTKAPPVCSIEEAPLARTREEKKTPPVTDDLLTSNPSEEVEEPTPAESPGLDAGSMAEGSGETPEAPSDAAAIAATDAPQLDSSWDATPEQPSN
ncbi:MAG: purine-binding chemotaxis protein CheW, partial [Magnetococcales bacterium]|nr:purine-binding chemotaxis protein CheW [Magnetococcales bacterium]